MELEVRSMTPFRRLNVNVDVSQGMGDKTAQCSEMIKGGI